MQARSQQPQSRFERRPPSPLEQRTAELKEFAFSLGAELFGVASAEDYALRFLEKPQPARFLENALSIVIIDLPFEPGTMATVLRPELAGLRVDAADQILVTPVHAVGAERFFLEEENEIINHELPLMGYKIAKYLRCAGYVSRIVPFRRWMGRGAKIPLPVPRMDAAALVSLFVLWAKSNESIYLSAEVG